MDITISLILAVLNILLLIGIFIWLLMRLPNKKMHEQLLKDEQLARHVEIKATLAQTNERLERELRREITESARGDRAEQAQSLTAIQTHLTQSLATFQSNLTQQLQQITDGNALRMREVRDTLDVQLAQLQKTNTAKLDEMRQTVDEKLQSTLQTRLGESFKQVADRLEQVHKGLGEMQTLAQGVGDLKHLLTNVKNRGTYGEAQLGALLEQVFVMDQYAAQVSTVPGSKNVVDYAIRLPGRSDDGSPVWLPIDSKFPTEDYERLLNAQEQADVAAIETAAKALEGQIRKEAKSIAEKYVSPPHTTDFAIMFLPSESLYAEVLRRPGLMDTLQRDHRVTLAGPTTLLAMLNSLQMGFRTLALEKRSSEVWQVLGAVKTQFGKFGDVLSSIRKQTQTVINTLDEADVRTRGMTRALKEVEALPEAETQNLLPLDKEPEDG
jgi:DNA recombination protein RmuC